MCEYVGVVEMGAKKIANNLVVAFAVHPLMHRFGHFDAMAAGVLTPRKAVPGVRVDKDAVHIEN
jgi:hypothetical protein